MKNLIYYCLIALFATGKLYAQESIAKSAPPQIVKDYIAEVKDPAVIFNGKEQTSYFSGLTNHPYLVTPEYSPAEIRHNQVEYKDMMLRLDMYRDELLIRLPDRPYNVVLEPEKVNRVILNGYTIVPISRYSWENAPMGNYALLLYEGKSLVIRKDQVVLNQKISIDNVSYTFMFKERVYICIDNVCYRVTNKKSVLKLFPGKKKELDAYAKQQKLNFTKNREQAAVAIVKQYEALSK